MFEIKNFDSWQEYDGFSEGSGRSEKIWLISDDKKIGLFKFPKIDPDVVAPTTEHVSEHLAHQLGNILGVPTAKVDMGTRNGRIGCMSYLVCEPGVNLVEGINFISGKYPNFDAEKMYDASTETYYCIDHIFSSVPSIIPNKIWVEMMLFDFLIGNADRHQSNWALLMELSVKKGIRIQLSQCPLYDNGSSLCCYVNENQISKYETKDIRTFEALVDSRSKSRIRIDGKKKALPKHSEVVRFLLENYPITKPVANRFVTRLDEEKINNLLAQYPESIISSRKKALICNVDGSAVFDSKWTEEALFNLLDNAVKYTPAGGKINISVKEYPMFAAIEVTDNGPGIPEEEQPKVFQRFYRGMAQTQEDGVGIGLYLVRQITEGQGGYVKVSSKHGEGSIFSLYLPKT